MMLPENDMPMQHSTEFAETFEALSHIIGEASTWKVCEYFQGEQVTFPKSILQFRRNREIRQKFHDGKNYIELSREYSLTTRQIRTIVHASVESDETYSQLPLQFN
jgi:Mor family transcriptional regulator